MKVMALSLGSSLALPESVFAQLAGPLDAAKLKFFNDSQIFRLFPLHSTE